MTEAPKRKSRKLGVVLKSKAGGFFIALGDTKSRDPKYNYSVEITIRDSAGAVVHQQTNGTLSLSDPRKFRENVPEALKFEVSAMLSNEQNSN